MISQIIITIDTEGKDVDLRNLQGVVKAIADAGFGEMTMKAVDGKKAEECDDDAEER